jgi:hypothetical protein
MENKFVVSRSYGTRVEIEFISKWKTCGIQEMMEIMVWPCKCQSNLDTVL